MKILFVAAEVAPFSSVGGLSQVMYFLPKALLKLGHDVRIFSAKYGVINKKWPMTMEYEGLKVPVGNDSRSLMCNVKSSRVSTHDPIVYFLENREYYELRANVYEYADDHIRFSLLSKGCLEWLRQQETFQPLSSVWFPDLIHANDWHTGYLVDMARRDLIYKDIFGHTPIIYTVHNFKHQGNGSYEFRYVQSEKRDVGVTPLPNLLSKDLISYNALLRGIINADLVNTVSRAHVDEVLTPEYGEGIDDILRVHQERLTGILNGLDTRAFNPMTDNLIKQRYSWRTLSRRAENKLALQREFSLPQHADIPLFALSGRMAPQKGIELLMKGLPHLLRHHALQFIALGGGDELYRQFFLELAQKFPDSVGVHLQPDFKLPRKVFSGADVLLMPSKFEPGGIVAMEAMRYGAVPLVRRTGGLGEIVTDFQPSTELGNGFSFLEFDPWALYGSMVEALTIYKSPILWKKLVQNAMRADFSWDHAAREYEELYHSAISNLIKR